MEFSIRIHIIKSEWSIVYNEGLQVILSKKIVCFSLKLDFVFAKCAELFAKVPVLGCFGVSGLQWVS